MRPAIPAAAQQASVQNKAMHSTARTNATASAAPWTMITPVINAPPANHPIEAANRHGAFARCEARHVSSEVQMALRKSCRSAVAKFRSGLPRQASREEEHHRPQREDRDDDQDTAHRSEIAVHAPSVSIRFRPSRLWAAPFNRFSPGEPAETSGQRSSGTSAAAASPGGRSRCAMRERSSSSSSSS